MTEDLQLYLGKIRSDAAECLVLGSIAGDGKREVFLRTAEHLNGLASELEKSISKVGADRTIGADRLEAPEHENTAAINEILQMRRPRPPTGRGDRAAFCRGYWLSFSAQYPPR